MQTNEKKSSVWILHMGLGLLLFGFWGALLFYHKQESTLTSSTGYKNGVSYIALPNILAPVIRNEVHKEREENPEDFVLNIKIPDLPRVFHVKQ